MTLRIDDPYELYKVALDRSNQRLKVALHAAQIHCTGGINVPRPELRRELREWFGQWHDELYRIYNTIPPCAEKW